MVEALKQAIAGGKDLDAKINLAREFLQVLALKSLSERGAFSSIAFLGGTALRLVFGARRFSEDLDFSLMSAKGYDFGALCAGLEKDFRLNGLEAVWDKKKAKTVNSGFLGFPGLPHALGLSGHKPEKLSIKLEVDTNPPAGWAAQTTMLRKMYMFNVAHYDLPSMFAGKLHACFYRRFTKGRDIYDLVWHLSGKVKPNFEQLNNAIAQSEGASPGVAAGNFKRFMLDRAGRIDMAAARKDAERFLEDKSELKLFDKDTLAAAIKSAG